MVESHDRFEGFKRQILETFNLRGYEVVSGPNIVSIGSGRFTFETLVKGSHRHLGEPFNGITGPETRVFFSHYDF